MKMKSQSVILLLVTVMMAHSLITADAKPGHLVVFGDSLSDTGNYLRLSKGVYPNATWFVGGRSSGGGMWPTFLSKSLGVKLENYAYFGAGACPSPDGIDVTGFVTAPDGFDQLGMYLKATTRHQLKKNIHVLFLGPASYVNYLVRVALGLYNTSTVPPPQPKDIVGCVLSIGETLLAKGAKKVVLGDVPSIGITPLLAPLPAEQRALANLTAMAHAALLSAGVAQLKAKYPKATVAYASALNFANNIYDHPKKYGFVNVTSPALILNQRIATYPFVGPSGRVPNHIRYMWYDGVHPGARVHLLLSKYLAKLLKAAKIV